MEELREELHSYIDKYGLTDPRTIVISQELDKLVNAEMKMQNKLN